MTDRRYPDRRRTPPARLGFPSILLLAALGAFAPGARAQNGPLDLDACIRLALEANPDYQSRGAALDATRADLVGARSARYPSVGLSASAARYENGGTGALGRQDVGVGLRQVLYQGGRVEAGVDAAASALAADEGALASARADLVLAVKQAWYRTAQGERLVRSAEEGLSRSRLNLEHADAQLSAGLGTRPDVLRARVDVSAAELELTRARNSLDGARALLNTLMGQPPTQPLELATDRAEAALLPVGSWEELRLRALDFRDELRVAEARSARQEARVRMSRSNFRPSVSADAGLYRGAAASQGLRENWSVGLVVSFPIFEGFAHSADLRAEQALLESARFDEIAVAQAIEGEVWDALLSETESARRLENAEALFAAATENLEASQESYRQGLGSMLALVDARTAFTGAEQTLIQAAYDRHIARAVLERVVEGDISGRNRP